MKKKNTKCDGIPPLPARAGGSDWIEERQAAHLAAFQEVRRMEPRELAALLGNAAEDCAERAGDLTCHDEAMPDLMREAACILAAEIVRNEKGCPANRTALQNALRDLLAGAGDLQRHAETSEHVSVKPELRQESENIRSNVRAIRAALRRMKGGSK